MGSRNRLYPYPSCLDFFGLKVDVVIQSLGQYYGTLRSSGLMTDLAFACMTFTKSPVAIHGWMTLASCFLVLFELYQYDWINIWLSRDMETLTNILSMMTQAPSLRSVIVRAAKAPAAS